MSTINRILNSENVSIACFLLGTGSFTYLYGRESIFLKHYVRYIQKHKDGEPVPIRSVSQFRLETVLNDLKISVYDRDYYDQFITKEPDPITCGARSVRQGVKIGIPEHFESTSINGVKAAFNVFHGRTIPWTSEDGEKLAQSLFLSDEAKNFAVAKAVLMGQNYYHFLHALFAPFFSWGYYTFTELIFSFKKLHIRSGLFTLSTYILSGILFGAVYLFCDNVLYLQYDKVTFEDALRISHAYIVGGIEYTDQVVERNKTLRNIIKKGDRYYDEDGDPKSLIYFSGIPPSVKAAMAKEFLRQYELTKEAMIPPPVNPNPHPIL